MIKKLKRNIRRKWSKNLPHVDFFIRQTEKQTSEIDPHDYFNSEDYFTKLLFLKPISDILFPIEKKNKKKKNKEIKKYVLIR